MTHRSHSRPLAQSDQSIGRLDLASQHSIVLQRTPARASAQTGPRTERPVHFGTVAARPLERQISDRWQELKRATSTLFHPLQPQQLSNDLELDDLAMDDDMLERVESCESCVVCMEVQRAVIFANCGHCCCCQQCAEHLSPQLCPLCRSPVRYQLKVAEYLPNGSVRAVLINAQMGEQT